MATTVKSPEIK